MGFFMNDHNPDYVVLGESQTYNFEKLTKAVQLVQNGAKLISTHLDTENLDSVGRKIVSFFFYFSINILCLTFFLFLLLFYIFMFSLLLVLSQLGKY